MAPLEQALAAFAAPALGIGARDGDVAEGRRRRCWVVAGDAAPLGDRRVFRGLWYVQQPSQRLLFALAPRIGVESASVLEERHEALEAVGATELASILDEAAAAIGASGENAAEFPPADEAPGANVLARPAVAEATPGERAPGPLVHAALDHERADTLATQILGNRGHG